MIGSSSIWNIVFVKYDILLIFDLLDQLSVMWLLLNLYNKNTSEGFMTRLILNVKHLCQTLLYVIGIVHLDSRRKTSRYLSAFHGVGDD